MNTNNVNEMIHIHVKFDVQNLQDHRATYVSIKINYFINYAYKRKIWDYKNADFDELI